MSNDFRHGSRGRDPVAEFLGHGEVSTVDRRIKRIAPANHRGRGLVDSVLAPLRRVFARRQKPRP